MKTTYISLLAFIMFGYANTRTDQTVSDNEHAKEKFFMALESELGQRRKEIAQEVSTKYQELKELAVNLSKLEVLDYTAHITQELVKTAAQQLEVQKDPTRAKKVAKLKKLTTLAIKEVEAAKKEIDREIKAISKKLNQLLGISRELLDKAHLQKAQELVDQATTNLNEALSGITQSK